MSTWLIILAVVAVAFFIAYLISPTFRKWAKWIGLGIVAIGGAVVAIGAIGKKKADGQADAKIEGDKAKVTEAENKIEADKAKIAEKDKEIKKQEEDIQKIADEAKKKAEENEKKPEQPGDAGKAADDFKKNW